MFCSNKLSIEFHSDSMRNSYHLVCECSHHMFMNKIGDEGKSRNEESIIPYLSLQLHNFVPKKLL